MKQGYAIVGFQMIHHDQLAPHPDAQLPIEQDDSASMDASVDSEGVLLPILVSAKPNAENRHWIYDGVNRWRSARKSPDISGLPCILANVPDVRKLALTCLGTGRKRSTGQRVMAYLEMHRAPVLEVAVIVGDGLVPGVRVKRMAGQMTGHEIPKKLEDFTAEAIARKLGVSDKDVRLGIELLRAEYMAPEAQKEPFLKQRLTLLAGGSSIRRWKAAVAGRKATAGTQRSGADYTDLLPKAMATVRNGFSAWPKLDWAYLDSKQPGRDSQGETVESAVAMLKVMPDVLRVQMRTLIMEQWPAHEKEELRLELEREKEAERKAKAEQKARR